MEERRLSLVGRDDEVRAVTTVLRSTVLRSTDRAQTLLVVGSAGVGKTAVLECARRAVIRDGAKALRLDWAAAGGEPGAPALADAVCRLLTKIHDGRLPARIAEIRRTELRTAGRDGELPLLHTMGKVLADAAHHVPFALVLDDADRMPSATASALALLLRAFRPAGMPVVMAGRSARPVLGGSGLVAAADRVLDLAPLPPDDVHALVEQRLGRPVDAELTAAVTTSLGPARGNPRAVLSVIEALEEDAGLLELDGWVQLAADPGTLRLCGDVTRLCGVGRPDLPPDADRMASAVTLAHLIGSGAFRVDDLGGLRRSAAARFGDVARTVDELATAGVLRVDRHGSLTFAVPAFAAALRALPPRSDLPLLHAAVVEEAIDRLGATTAGTVHPRMAEHVAAAGSVLGAEVAVPLLLAAARETAGPAPDQAARAYGEALRRLPPEAEQTPGVLREAAELGLRRGDFGAVLTLGEPMSACFEARRHAGRADQDAPGAQLEFAAQAWALAALHEHRLLDGDGAWLRPWAAVRRMPLGTQLAALGGRYGIGPVLPWAVRGRLMAADRPAAGRTRAGDSGSGNGSASDNRAPTDGGPVADERLPGFTLMPSAEQVRLIAAAVGSRVELERATQELPDLGTEQGAVERVRSAAAYGDLAGAFESALGDGYVMGTDSTAARYHAMVGAYLAGRWDEALAYARRIEARGRSGGGPGPGLLARVLAAEIHWMSGDRDRAEQWLGRVPDTLVHPLAGRVRLGVGYAAGQVTQAFESGWRDLRRARARGLLAGLDRVPLRIQRFSTRQHLSVSGWRALKELEALDQESGSVMARESLLLGRVLLGNDVGDAREALRLLEERGDRPQIVLCHEHLAMVSDNPDPWLPGAVRGAEEMGMRHVERVTLSRRAQSRGLKVPAYTRRPPEDGLDELDLRLVELVSDGATNRQIAARLACSDKTVEQRLTRLFRLTGHRSRVELAASWLDGTFVHVGAPPGGGRLAPDARSRPYPGVGRTRSTERRAAPLGG